MPLRARPITTHAVDTGRELSRVLPHILGGRIEGPLVLVLSMINQIALGIVVYPIARTLVVEIGLGQILLLFPPAMLLSMAPISFGSWGVREGAMVFLFGTAGVSAEAALGTSVLFGLVTTAAGLFGGVLWLAERRAKPELT